MCLESESPWKGRRAPHPLQKDWGTLHCAIWFVFILIVRFLQTWLQGEHLPYTAYVPFLQSHVKCSWNMMWVVVIFTMDVQIVHVFMSHAIVIGIHNFVKHFLNNSLKLQLWLYVSWQWACILFLTVFIITLLGDDSPGGVLAVNGLSSQFVMDCHNNFCWEWYKNESFTFS